MSASGKNYYKNFVLIMVNWEGILLKLKERVIWLNLEIGKKFLNLNL